MMRTVESQNAFLVGILFCFLAANSPAWAIEVEGDVWGVWSPDNNPYEVIGELRVPPDSMLTIEAGCQVYFLDHYKFIVDTNAILIAQGSEEDLISFTALDPLEGWHGLRFYQSSGNSVLEYCSLQYGNASGYGFEEFGGAIFLYDSPITIRNCDINNNKARSGGGVYCYYSDATIENNRIFSNYAVRFGGGIKIRECNPSISNNRIFDNISGHSGGGIEVSFSDSDVIGNSIYGNRAINGGGAYLRNCSVVFNGNTVTANQSSLGGGIFIKNSSPVIGTAENRCNIYDNSAGSGLDLFAEDCPIIQAFIDTFTILIPDDYLAYPIDNYESDVNFGYYSLIFTDAYVSPAGDNSNDGLTPQTPLKNIRNALIRMVSDPENPLIVYLLRGTYGQDSNNEHFPINAKSYVSILGDEPHAAILDGQGLSNLIYCSNDSGVSIADLTLTNGVSDTGGCIFSEGSQISITGNVINRNSSSEGGAIYSRDSQLNIAGNEIFNNVSLGHGGAVYCTGNIGTVIEYNNIHSDTAFGLGGAVYVDEGSYEFLNNNFSFNSANLSGGAIYCNSSLLSIDSNTISDNYADGNGGALHLLDCSPTSLYHNTISSNHATGNGAGVYADSCRNSNVISNVFTENRADGSYGGIYWRGDTTMINDNIIETNIAGVHGGGIGFHIPGVVFEDNIIRSNVAGSNGGGLLLGTEFDCDIGPNLITGNNATTGGGISIINTDVVFHGTAITFNRAVNGGGVYSHFRSDVTLGTTENPCNIYSNYSSFGNDLYYQGHRNYPDMIVYVHADTFTLEEPDNHLIFNEHYYDIRINHGYYERIFGDVYVSPEGDNFNDGLTPQTPLRNISVALIRISSSVSLIRTIFILPGLYSASSTGEIFPLNTKTGTILLGTSNEECILDGELEDRLAFAWYDTLLTFRNLTFTRGNNGLGLLHARQVVIEDNVFKENINVESGYSGGGILAQNSLLGMKRNLVINNDAPNGNGGGAYFHSSVCRLEKNTFYGNHTGGVGGAISLQGSNFYALNNIFWGNNADGGSDEISPQGRLYELIYNDIEGGFAGEGNIDIDPMFIDPANEDFHLTPGSPCIDTGDPRSPLDPDGTWADMGAFYFDQVTGIFEDDHLLPIEYELEQNYPNPFNNNTIIRFAIPEEQWISLRVYDITGRLTVSIINGLVQPGFHEITWDGNTMNGDPASSGIYFYEMRSAEKTINRKMTLLK